MATLSRVASLPKGASLPKVKKPPKTSKKTKAVEKLQTKYDKYAVEGDPKAWTKKVTAEEAKWADNFLKEGGSLEMLKKEPIGRRNAVAKLSKIKKAMENPNIGKNFIQRWPKLSGTLIGLLLTGVLTWLICTQIADENPCCWQTFKNDPNNTERIQVNCSQASCNCKSSGNTTSNTCATPTCDSEDGKKRGVDYYWDKPTPLEVLAVAASVVEESETEKEKVTNPSSGSEDILSSNYSIYYIGIGVVVVAVIFVIFMIYFKKNILITQFRFKKSLNI